MADAATHRLDRMRNALTVQMLLITLVTVAFLMMQGVGAAVAALFGGATALLNSLLLVWRAGRTERGPALSAQQSIRVLYLSALERFAAVAMMFMGGMGVLRLDPLPMLVGFVVVLPTLLMQGRTRRG